ncbi:MAG: hypothetical protein ABIH19_01425 [Candidatus Omnitrophota bacterium]
MRKARKQKWQKPKLFVLFRSDSQEKVLASCKSTVRAAGGGGGFWWGACEWTEWSCDNSCSTVSSS